MASAKQKEQIGPFVVERVLGRGAQGVVYLARDNRLNRFVAVKTIAPEKIGKQFNAKQLEKEASAAAKLKHPNIVPLYDIGDHRGVPYLVFEYIDGVTLTETIAQRGEHSVFDVLKIALGVLDGLIHAHQQGVIHCDIKPSNVLLDANSTARISDFGISRLLCDSATDKSSMQGSLRYLAPEVVSEKPIDARSDIFSFGQLLYELLTGEKAIKATASAAILYEIAHGEPTRPSSIIESLDQRLDAIVLTATARNPDDRYKSAADVKKALEEFLADQSQLTGEDNEGKGNTATVNYLLTKIRRDADFPAFSQHITEINRLASSDSDTTVIELTNAVLKDYSLTNKLLRLVNSPVYGQFGGQINTVSRAITILGFDNIRMLAVGLLVFDQIKNRPQAKALMEANMWCFVGAFVARKIVDKDRRHDTEMTFIAALLHKLGTLLVIYYLPDEYEAIQKLVEQQGMSEDDAARKILGVHFHVLGQRVGETWGLPPLLLNAMEPPADRGIREGTDSAASVLNTVGFASSLLEIVSASDADPEKQKEQRKTLLDHYGKVVKIDAKQLQGIVESSLEQAGELMEFPAEWQAELRARLAVASGKAPPKSVAPSAESGSSDNGGDATILLRGVSDVTSMMMGEHGLSDILVTVLESIYRGLGLNRVVLLINHAAKKTLVVRFGFAPDLDELKAKMKIPLEAKDAVGESLRKKEDLLINDVATIGSDVVLPNWCTAALRARSVGVYPLVIKDSLIGAIYFDSLNAGSITAEQVAHIQALRNQASLAIKMHS